MNHKILGVLSLLFCVGCDEIKGQLNVYSSLDLKNKDKVSTLFKGSHEVGVKLNQDKREVEIKFVDTYGEERKASLKLSQTKALPKNNGAFEVSALESNQNFDLRGSLETVHNRDEIRHERESCSYSLPSGQECYYTQGRDQYGRVYRNHRCRTVRRAHYGYRNVRYRVRSTNVTLDLAFYKPSENELLGEFNSHKISTETYREHTGPCRL